MNHPPMLATPLPELIGQRVTLRSFGPQDITPRYIGWLNDPEVVRYSNQRFQRHDRASGERYLASFVGSANLMVKVLLSASAGTPERAIGTLTAYRSLHHGTADIGVLIGDREVWGQGLGLDAWRTLCDWLAEQPGLRKLTCGTLSVNRAMLRLAERAGFSREGSRPAQELVDGQPVDIVHFGRFTARSAPTQAGLERRGGVDRRALPRA